MCAVAKIDHLHDRHDAINCVRTTEGLRTYHLQTTAHGRAMDIFVSDC